MDIPVGPDSQDIALANGFLWIAFADGHIEALTQEGQPAAVVRTDLGTVALATDGRRLWAAHRNGSISQIEATTGAVTARWTIPCSRCLLRGIHWDGAALFVSNFGENALARIDVETGAITTLPPVAEGPTAILSDPYGLLVLHQSLQENSVVLTRLDHAGQPVNSFSAAGFPTAIASGDDAFWLALRDADRGFISRYDAATLAEVWRVEAAPVGALLLAPPGLFSAESADATVTLRDPESGEVLAVYPTGDLPQALAYENGLLWVLNRRGESLTRLWVGRPSG